MVKIDRIAGRALVLRGADIDTDRIIPARFLLQPTFEGLEDKAFFDDRAQVRATGGVHPLDDPRFAGAAVMIVGRNFGCGSSREHAPQALARRGIRAFVGESFGDIFAQNCVMLGRACVCLAPEELAQLMGVVEADPAAEVVVDVAEESVSAGGRMFGARMESAARRQLLDGSWDSVGQLLEAREEVERVAAGLPYVGGF